MDSVDVAVVGAGAVGLAVARALACSGLETLILEAQDTIGTQTSSRNSEVIHAGIYYEPGSLKAQLCVRGSELLYEFCGRYGVPNRPCGKLIVATNDDQLITLSGIRANALRNGVTLQWLDQGQARAIEPQVQCVGALHSPRTGIIDSHAYMHALLGLAEDNGALIAFKSPVTRICLGADGIEIATEGFDPVVRARILVNCAGLHASVIASLIEGFPGDHIPRTFFAKGSYFMLAGRSPFDRLIYPVPEAGGLGVHATLDLGGRVRFGPDVQWISEIDYGVDVTRANNFYESIRSYWPGIPEGSLAPGYAGIRPKISRAGEPAADFRIEGPAQHGAPSVINLFAIESPGLTASLAIGDYVADMVRGLLA